MARTAKLTSSLPKLAVTPELRDRVEAVADAAEVGMSDVVRDCIMAVLPSLELQLGLVEIEDIDEHEATDWAAHERAIPAETPAGMLDLDQLERPRAVPGTATGWGPDRPRE